MLGLRWLRVGSVLGLRWLGVDDDQYSFIVENKSLMNSHEKQTKTCERSEDVAESPVMKTSLTHSVADAIRSAMQSQGINIQQLADRAGMKRTVVSMILNGHQSATETTVKRIAEGLGLSFVCGFAAQSTKSKKRTA